MKSVNSTEKTLEGQSATKNEAIHKDFRIGNLIEYDGRIFEIDSTAEIYPTLNTAEFGIGVVDWNNIKPISLTEEWSIKFGFEKKYFKSEHFDIKFYYYELNQNRIYLIEKGFEFELYVLEELCFLGRTYKYVHQLQNLYYALTGFELIFIAQGLKSINLK